MPNNEIRDIEQQICTLMGKLDKFQQSNLGNEVTNYSVPTITIDIMIYLFTLVTILPIVNQ